MNAKIVKCGDLTIDLDNETVFVGDKEIYLSKTEYRVLVILANNYGEPVSIPDILDKLYEKRRIRPNKTVIYVYISKIRKKIYDAVGDDSCIETFTYNGFVLGFNEMKG